MASSPLRTTPTCFNDLPPEVCGPLTRYLRDKYLRRMRLVNRYWNLTCRATLQKRKRFPFNTFNLNSLKKLAGFNKAFAEYTPTDDIAAGRFCFTLPALNTAAAREHLETFGQRFGHLVTTLSVNLAKKAPEPFWDDNGRYQRPIALPQSDTVRDTVLAHVTLLLQKVKGQLQHLELLHCADVRSCAVGDDPFPSLLSLTVGIGPTVARLTVGEKVDANEANCDESFILLLSKKVPALQRFECKALRGSSGDDPLFLATVLDNLVQVNGQLEVKLGLELVQNRGDSSVLLSKLLTVAVRIVELDLVVRGDHETVGKALQWIGAQNDWLKKLTVKVKFDSNETPLSGLKLPSLAALEELEYVQKTVESLLQYTAADYPNLRKVTTASTGNDFTVALPQVTDLTLVRTWYTELVPWKLHGLYGGGAVFRFPPFANVESLTCSIKFLDLGSITKLTNLRRFTLTVDYQSEKLYPFWKRVTHGAPKLSLRQILALPEPSEDEVRGRTEPCFSNLKNLKEFKMAMYEYYIRGNVDMDALLWLSKTKRLQRLEKLQLNDSSYDGRDNGGDAVPDFYVTDLRHYHNYVFTC